jgi:hypothetical protein
MKGGIVVPEETASARQRLNKHISTSTDMHATIEDLLERMFSMQSMLRLCSKDERGKLVS